MVLVNGRPCGHIYPKRGLRQGDPISLYLFILCAEALSALLMKANEKGVLDGVPTSRRGLRVSHLLFADNSLLFCRSTPTQWENLTNVLKVYEDASAQCLNNNKMSIFFGRNMAAEDKRQILEISGLSDSQRYDTYLGLPALVGKSQTAAFRGIVDRVWKKLQDWKIKFLSQAGREILLKAVVQAILTYCISVFLLPRALCAEINSHMRKFWWGSKENKSRVNWMSWGRSGLSKEAGGLGFRDFMSFNKALLAKQAWRLWQNLDSLAGKILKAKYYPDSSVLEAKVGRRPSFTWRSIHSSYDLLREGLMWRVGNGGKIKIWNDRWMFDWVWRNSLIPAIWNPNDTVDKLIDQDSEWWNKEVLDYSSLRRK